MMGRGLKGIKVRMRRGKVKKMKRERGKKVGRTGIKRKETKESSFVIPRALLPLAR
jgi:hypothetical protein